MKMPIYPIMGKAQILKNGDFRELKLENFIEWFVCDQFLNNTHLMGKI